MKNFYKAISNSVYDPLTGVRTAFLHKGTAMNSYGCRMEARTKINSHLSTQGEKWYFILDGDAQIYLADLIDGELTNKRYFNIMSGHTFCVPENTVHQIKAITRLDLIFLCPDPHSGANSLLQRDLV